MGLVQFYKGFLFFIFGLLIILMVPGDEVNFGYDKQIY